MMKILRKTLIIMMYLAMLVLIMIFFTGNGTFIYEGI